MNIANKLTLCRLLGTVLFIALLLSGLPYTKSISLIIFILACLTDWIDGKLARRLQIESDFGRLMDPLVDKILMTSAFIAFIEIPEISLSSVIVIIIIGREFCITGLRLLAASKGTIIPADVLGKHKTISQVTAIISILVYLSYLELNRSFSFIALPAGLEKFYVFYINSVLVITVIMTLVSGFSYLRKSWTLIKSDV
ncbi:MAG: CDP-diacylglycerol--glycerol-3-phosphate 3-phosphatidyltransferase [bacterium]|nr:CDP-diacylglycerol--glycerol-3-phosphate 3-phosphatidyltransferase [bacterium]